MTHEILQRLMDRLHVGEDHKEVLFDLLLELDAPEPGIDWEAQNKIAQACEKKDCERALLALAEWYPTPVEGYGFNTNWAISDLCRAIGELRSVARGGVKRVRDFKRCEGLYLKWSLPMAEPNTPVVIERVNGDCSVSEFIIARDEAHHLITQLQNFLRSDPA